MGQTSIRVDTTAAGQRLSPLLFGHNLEHTRRCIWEGLSAQILRNRKLCGPPNQNGLAADWCRIGPESTHFRLHGDADAYLRHRDIEPDNWRFDAQQQRIESFSPGTAGMGQEHLTLPAGRHEFRIALRAAEPMDVRVRVLDRDRRQELWADTIRVRPGAWQEEKRHFDLAAANDDGRIEITFDGPGAIIVGMTALQPAATFLGLRRDVIELLKRIGVPLLRWPGGNFAGDYRWEDGLLPVDQRAGLPAFITETLRYTRNFDTHEIGTDEFLALCRELGAEPSITINISLQGPQEAANWVEYCNGGPETKFGRLRAKRGHPEPYRVRFWSLGNEAGYAHMAGPNRVEDYCEMSIRCADAMRAVDPSIELIASGLWNVRWAQQTTKAAYAAYDHVSFHWYVHLPPSWQGIDGLEAMRAIARTPAEKDFPRVAEVRQAMDATAGRKVGIAYDEWNIFWAWSRTPNIADGMYAACFMHELSRRAGELGITQAAYFEPVNEGAIIVEPATARLTPVGQVMELFKVHHGAKLLPVAAEGDADVDVLATRGEDGSINVTVANRRPDSAASVAIVIAGAAANAESGWRLVSLAPDPSLLGDRAIPSVRYAATERQVRPSADGVRLELPPYAVARLSIPPDP